jgi:very-short-patch-repair endonuclease
MKLLALLIALLFAVVLIALVFRFIFVKPKLPYARAPLFSEAEKQFFGVLLEAVGDRFLVLAKVRLADLVRVRGLSGQEYLAASNRIQRKHVDFVLCDRRSLEAACVVELDDRSHEQKERRERDAFVDGALDAAGIPVLRVPCRRAYAAADLRRQVLGKAG